MNTYGGGSNNRFFHSLERSTTTVTTTTSKSAGRSGREYDRGYVGMVTCTSQKSGGSEPKGGTLSCRVERIGSRRPCLYGRADSSGIIVWYQIAGAVREIAYDATRVSR